jgi:hypothetical protein
VRRVHADLLDVRAAVDHVGDDEADRLVVLVGGDPGPARPAVTGQRFGRQRKRVCRRGHSDVTERVTGGKLDRLEPADVFGPGLPDRDATRFRSHGTEVWQELPKSHQEVSG